MRGHFALSAVLHAAVIGLLAAGFWNLRPKPPPKPQLALEATVVDESAVAREMQQARGRGAATRAAATRGPGASGTVAARARGRRAEARRDEEAARAGRERSKQAARRASSAKATEARGEAEEGAARPRLLPTRSARQTKRACKREREAELKRRLAEEERRDAAVDAGLLEQYIAQIQARIQRAWIRPPTARSGLNCVVHVTQVPGGEVVGVRVGECNGDEFVRQSIEAAVLKASPLPRAARSGVVRAKPETGVQTENDMRARVDEADGCVAC